MTPPTIIHSTEDHIKYEFNSITLLKFSYNLSTLHTTKPDTKY